MNLERNEFAVLRALGFPQTSISLLLISESLILCLSGAALGLLMSVAISETVRPYVEQIVRPFVITPMTFIAGLGLGGLLGVAIGSVPAWLASRHSIVDGVRKS